MSVKGQSKFTYFSFQNPESFLESLSNCALLPTVSFDLCLEVVYVGSASHWARVGLTFWLVSWFPVRLLI